MLLPGQILHVVFFNAIISLNNYLCPVSVFLGTWNSDPRGLSWLCKFTGSLKCHCESESPKSDISVVGSPRKQGFCKCGFSANLPHEVVGSLTELGFVNFLKTEQLPQKHPNFGLENSWPDIVLVLWLCRNLSGSGSIHMSRTYMSCGFLMSFSVDFASLTT